MNAELSATLLTGVLFLIVYAWISLLVKVVRQRQILPFEPRGETPWGVVAVVLSFFLLIGAQIAVVLPLAPPTDVDPTAAQTGTLLTWTAIVILAATVISIACIHLVTKASLADFGISLDHVPRDVAVGVGAFLILAPVTFAIQFVFVEVFGLESHHPLIELLKEDSSGKLFGVVTVLAVIVAPISEEYFFRVLLQGWLERLFGVCPTGHAAQMQAPASNVAFVGEDESRAPAARTGEPERNPYATPSLGDAAACSPDRPQGRTVLFAPIAISSASFALMHWSHGPDPAALFILALGLGYVYQRTHRWLPSVITHACLNGTTMLLLWFGLDQLPT